MSGSADAVTLTWPASTVALLTLNRPRVRNAMTEELTSAWHERIEQLRENERVRVLVVAGAGPSFCAGADLSWLDQAAESDVTPDRIRRRMLPFYRTWLAARELPFPVIAAVNGPTIGAGLALALSCDLRYAAPTATFAAPFIHLGTHTGMAMTALLPEAIGASRAREMLYTGRPVTAEEAHRWGLVAGVAADVVAEAVTVATRLSEAAPIATRLLKRGLEQGRYGFNASLEWEALAQPVSLTTRDIHEGVQAQREHRPPRFEDH
ncbi:enoyl-CoA hydratase/isomerase family protein [Streptomyces sp. NPDC048277]|uniref:enoyl-CoA hydratase/isomerase family protein n=1 Tax=Streptomyces sp. NPDC048277 TaxID=3155027 RepID=UPI003402AFFE